MPEWNPRANDLFVQAVEIEAPADRRLFLDQQCGDDDALRAQVESLITAGGKVGSFLEKPAVPVPPPGDATAPFCPLTEGPGTVIGPYKLLQHIGEGGFGAVYMAEQEHPVRRKVALKIIKLGMGTREVIARFESERQALAMMEHPNIARVFDAGATESGRPYFVMELVRGVPITEFCDRNRFSAAQRLKLFVAVCHAIQHAHHKGVIHRDIKPSNVMVTLHDGVPVVKVIDFGVAKATAQKLTERTLFTAYGQMVGTPAYMSPEQAEMSGLDIDTRSDIYSLGVLLYELLTGTTPLDSGQLRKAGYAEMQRLIREEEAPRPSTRFSSLGGEATVLATNRGTDVKRLSQLLRSDLDWVVMKALEKDRSRRYGSPATFAADVERYLNDDAVEACPPTLGYRLKKAYRRNKAALATVGAVAAALVAGTAVSAWLAVAARRAEASAVVERDDREQARRAEQAQRELADRNAALAEHERGNAVAARESLRRTHYAAQINLAQAALADGDVPRTDALLNELKPGPSEADLRGFEWHYLRNRYRDEESSVTIPGTAGLLPTLSTDGSRAIFLLRPDPASDRARFATYDLASGKQVGLFTSPFRTLSPGEISFQSVITSVNRDGSRVVLVNIAESLATVHDTTSGREIHRRKLPNMSERRTQLSLSSDGRHLLATEIAGPRPGAGPPAGESASLFDLETGREAKAWDETAGRVCLGGDGTRLAYCRNEREIVIESVKTGMVEKTIAVPGLARTGVRSFSADGKRLLLTSAVGAGGPAIGLPERTFDVQLLDVETGRASSPVRLPGPPTQVSADGRWVAVQRGDVTGTFRYDVIDAATGVTVREVRCPVRLASVAFSPEGNRLVIGGADGAVRTWNLSATQSGDGTTTAEWCIARSAGHTRFLLSVPNREKSATQFRVVDDRGRTVATKVFATHLTWGSIDSYPRLDPGGRRVAYTTVTATADAPARFTKQIRVWDVESDTDRPVGDAWASDLSAEPRLSFHPAGTHLAALVLRRRDETTETVLQIHDLKSGKVAESNAIAGVLDMGLPGLGSFTELYDTAGTLPLKFRAGDKLTACRFDGVTAAPLPFAEPGPFESRWAKGADGRYTVEEVIDRERMTPAQRDFLEQKHRNGEAVRLPASSVVVRDTVSAATLLTAQEAERNIRTVVLSPAGGLLLVCFEARPTGNARVFGVERLYRIYRLSDGHTLYEFQTLSPTTTVEFSPDDRRLMIFQSQSPMATSRVGSGVCLRDAETGRELLTLQVPPAHRTVAFSSDGTRLYSLRGGGGPQAVGPAIHFWDGSPRPEPKQP